MRKQILGIVIILGMTLLAACAPQAAPATSAPQAPSAAKPAAGGPAAAPAAPARAAWEAEWEKVLTEAKKEGKVVMASTLTSESRTAIVQGLGKTYGIPVEAIVGRSTEISAKILAERRVGLYTFDVYVGGTTTAFSDWKPAGILDPVDQSFILPDVTDPQLIKKIWYRGELWFVDKDHTVLATLMYPQPPLAVNTTLVKPGEIKSYNDFLDPKWKGKININDPTQPGSWFQSFILQIFGPDWLRNLAKNEPVIMRDQRLQVEWLAHGKAAIALGMFAGAYTEFKNAGAPIQSLTPAEGTWLSAGSGALHVYNKQPHPNASKVFVNWLLSKEGQTALSKAWGGQSAREDVPTDFLDPEQVRQAGVKYWEKDREAAALKRTDDLKVAKEIFGPLIK